jgi:hypothetical protein
MIKSIAFGAGALSASFAALAFIFFLISIVMCFKVGWGPQGPMDPGWGIVTILMGGICFVTGIIGLLLIRFGRRHNPN